MAQWTSRADICGLFSGFAAAERPGAAECWCPLEPGLPGRIPHKRWSEGRAAPSALPEQHVLRFVDLGCQVRAAAGVGVVCYHDAAVRILRA